VQKTIGTEFEIIRIDNNIEQLGISQAYNKGALQARFDHLLFIHEDVLFNTNNWGVTLIHYFAILENPGVLGIAGSNYKTFMPSGWWNRFLENRCVNLIQQNKFVNLPPEHISINATEAAPVFAVDGVFMAMKKSVYQQESFNEKMPGFHGYDLDISLRVARKFQNYFIPDMLITHLSEGKTNGEWIENVLTVHAQHKKHLPLTLNGWQVKTERIALYDFLSKVTDSEFSRAKKHSLFKNVMQYALAKLDFASVALISAKAYARWIRNVLMKKN